MSWPLWVLAEIAICATDLAEVIGTAIGLNLLFGIPLEIGVLITALDVFLILWMQNLGFRWIEAFIVTLLGVIAVCFARADRDGRSRLGRGDPRLCADHSRSSPIPTCSISRIGIIGATVMPHNLYLHSGVVQTRRFGDSVEDKREAIKLATTDSTIALMFALLINASILILAAATFNKAGKTDVAELGQAHSFLAPLLGLGHRADPVRHCAAVLRPEFDRDGDAGRSDRDGGLSSTSACRPGRGGWSRARIAIVPAAIVTIWYGEAGTAKLLILSQVVLGLALPFAIVPLVMFTADRSKMGALAAPRWVTAAGRTDGGAADRAEFQAAGRPDFRLRPVTFPRGSSRRASTVPAAGSGPCSPSCASPRPNSRDRRKAGPCGLRARYDRES